MTGSRRRIVIDRERLVRWYDFQARFYSRWRDDYDGPAVRQVVAWLRAGTPPRRILDAGCGTGLFTLGLARTHADWFVDGLDASAGMLVVARRGATRFGLGNVSFQQGTLEELPFAAAAFDAVVIGGVFPNLNDHGAVLRELHRVLKPAGRLVVIEYQSTEMTPAVRALFRMMIFGYRVISFVFRRYRFADRWGLGNSTIDRSAFERELASAGFRIRELVSRGPQCLFLLER